jgi:toxin ParE1/3/4
LIVSWLPRALADRDAQIDFIAKDSPKAAIEQGDRIASQVEMLEANPEIGRIGRVAGTPELVVSRTPFIVVYRNRLERIEILRVLHGAQMWPPAPKP